MGEVYRARDTKLDRDVALKTPRLDLNRDAALLGRLASEAKAIAALNHPNIVTIYSVDEANAILFLTMELVQGQSLADILQGESLPLETFFELALPLVEAIKSAHARGFVHRDLKPANFKIDGEDRPKILDFGLAKFHHCGSPSGSNVQETLDVTVDERI